MEITLTITRKQGGEIAVAGPIADKVVFYGLLEAARDACQEWHEKNASGVIPARAMPMGRV